MLGRTISLQQVVAGLKLVLQDLSSLLHDPRGTKLSTSQALADGTTNCLSVLKDLERKIDPGREGGKP